MINKLPDMVEPEGREEDGMIRMKNMALVWRCEEILFLPGVSASNDAYDFTLRFVLVFLVSMHIVSCLALLFFGRKAAQPVQHMKVFYCLDKMFVAYRYPRSLERFLTFQHYLFYFFDTLL